VLYADDILLYKTIYFIPSRLCPVAVRHHETVTISTGQIDSQLDGRTDREVASWRLHAGH